MVHFRILDSHKNKRNMKEMITRKRSKKIIQKLDNVNSSISMYPFKLNNTNNNNKMKYVRCNSIRQQFIFFTIIIIIFNSIQDINSFPTYLLSKSNCFTQLSTDEVIMNHGVISYDDSDDLDMYIKAFAPSDGSDISNLPHHLNKTTVIIPKGGYPVVVSIHMVTTNKNTNPNYQWAIDVIDNNINSNDPDNKPLAYFVDGSCKNRIRIAGRSDEITSITIEKEGAQIIGAWAAGMEAVRLTPILTFISNDNNNNNNAAIIEDKKVIIDPQKIIDENYRKKLGSHDELLKEQINKHREKLKQNLYNKNSESNSQKDINNNNNKHYDDNIVKRQTIDEQEDQLKEFLLQDKHSDVNDKEVHDNNNNNNNEDNDHPYRFEFNQLYNVIQNKINSLKSSEMKFHITSYSYYKGCCIFIIMLLSTTKLCLWISLRSNGGSIKGRRDL